MKLEASKCTILLQHWKHGIEHILARMQLMLKGQQLRGIMAIY